MQRETILFYRSFYEAIKLLSDKSRLNLYDSVMELYFECDENLSNLEQLCDKIEIKLKQNRSIFAQFLLIKPQIIANLMKYKNGCKGAEYGALGAEYGKLGGRPKKPPKNPPKEKGIKNKEEGVRNKEEGIMKNDPSFKKEKKEKKLNFSEKENFKNSLSSFCEKNFNFPSSSSSSSCSSPFKEGIHSKPSLLEENRGEVYPNAPDLEGFEEGRGQIDPPLEEEKQPVTSCNQLEPVTDYHGLNKGELCPNAPDLADVNHIADVGDMVELSSNSKQLPQNPRPKWDRNPDIMFDADVNRVFEIYAKECKSLIPLGYEKRDMAYRQKIKEFLGVISGDFAYFTDVCKKANDLKAIELRDSRRKIDLKTLINCHARIFSGFYKTETDSGPDYLAIAEAAQKRYEENYK